MPINKNRQIVPGHGFFYDLSIKAKLILRLISDPRVSFLVKLLPFGSLLYAVFPLDIPGPIDDAAVIALACYLFVELCPPEIVEEHYRELQSTIPGQYHNVDDDEKVVDAKFHDADENKSDNP